MADLAVTAASVLKGANAQTKTGTSGATFTAGQSVYEDSATGTVKLADANLSTAAEDTKGITLHSSISGQPITYQTGGDINPGATVVVGETYVQSATAGGIAPIADLATGHNVTYLGIGTSASNIRLNIQNTGVIHA